MGIISSVIRHFSEFVNIDVKSRKNNASVHPSAKIVATFAILIFITQFASITDMLVLFLLLVILTISIKGFNSLFFEPMLFMLMFAAITAIFYILVNYQTFLFEISLNFLEILETKGVIYFSLILAFRLVLSMLLLFTTPISEFLQGLRSLKIPRVFVNLFGVTFRYIFLLSQELASVSIAKELRAPYIPGIKARFNALGNVYAAVLNRSINRGNEVYKAMSLRGSTSNFISKSRAYSRLKTTLFSVGIISLIIIQVLYF